MGLFQRNRLHRINHVTVDGATATYQYHPEHEIWIVRVAGQPTGVAPDKETAKQVATVLLMARDELHIDRAFEYLRWADNAWPGLATEELIETVMKHYPDACRQALVDVLKRGRPE